MDILGLEGCASSGGACKASFLIGAHRSFIDAEAIFTPLQQLFERIPSINSLQ
jgi:hypothetical protein